MLQISTELLAKLAECKSQTEWQGVGCWDIGSEQRWRVTTNCWGGEEGWNAEVEGKGGMHATVNGQAGAIQSLSYIKLLPN